MAFSPIFNGDEFAFIEEIVEFLHSFLAKTSVSEIFYPAQWQWWSIRVEIFGVKI